MKRSPHIVVVLGIIIVVLVPLVVYSAAVPSESEEGLVGVEDSTQCMEEPKGWQFEGGLGIPSIGGVDPQEGFPQFFLWLYYLGLGTIGVLALLMLVIGGVRYMAAVGNPGGQEAAKGQVTQAVLGLLLLLGSWLILNTISPEFTRLEGLKFIVPEGIQPAKRACEVAGGITISLDELAKTSYSVKRCQEDFDAGSDERNDCMCKAGFFTIRDDDQEPTSCAYAYLSTMQSLLKVSPCEVECSGIWEDINNLTSTEDNKLTQECTQCIKAKVTTVDDKDSDWDYCDVTVLAGTSFCVVCEDENTCYSPPTYAIPPEPQVGPPPGPGPT